MRTFHQILEKLGGKRIEFSLENRIFNVASFVLSILATLATIINLILQVNYALTSMTAASIFIFGLFFYFSRYKGKFNSLYLPFLFLINIIAGILWFLNGGTHGPIGFGYMMLVTIAVIVGKRRDQVFLVTLIIAMLLFLFFIEYNYPLSIIGYEDEKTRFFDFTSTLIIFIFLTSIVVRALKKNYDDERISVENIKHELDSGIAYAGKIQKALMVSPDLINDYFTDAFILSLPKGEVNGDFYWLKRSGSRRMVIVADSTGSGVSVAMVNILGISLLNEIVAKNPDVEADEILNQLRVKLNSSLRTEENIETMQFDFDISLCVFDEKNQKMQFAGAGNPIYLIRENKLERLDAERLPINFNDIEILYSKMEKNLKKGDRIYLFTDGYIDQFGGSSGKKFMSKQFKELLLEIHNQEMSQQKSQLLRTLNQWKGNEYEQVDDILVVGIEI